MNTYKNIEDFQTVTYNVAGQKLSNNKATSLKVYANNTAYINNKKIQLSNEDVDTLENARCELYITRVLNNAVDNTIYFKDGSFYIDEKSSHPFSQFETSKTEELRNELNNAGIKIIDLPSKYENK